MTKKVKPEDDTKQLEDDRKQPVDDTKQPEDDTNDINAKSP